MYVLKKKILNFLLQVKSALTVVGLSDVAQYCKVKTISNPVRKALEKSSQLNKFSEASFTPTHYSKQSVAGIIVFAASATV